MFQVECSATWGTLGERADTGLSRLSIFIRPPIGSIMPAMNGFLAKGYFDDSQTSEEIWTIGGYVGGLLHWEAFEALWPLVLATHEVPYFHMRDQPEARKSAIPWNECVAPSAEATVTNSEVSNELPDKPRSGTLKTSATSFRPIRSALRRFGGFVAKYMGDGVLIYFGYPQAH
jgi:hypothetical protein